MANLAQQEETFEEEYQEYDEFDDEDNDRGLSGLAVLMMGIIMIGAFASVVWVAYKQGLKVGRENSAIETPYVAADPEPLKIETADGGEAVADREVYDAYDGKDEEPVTTLAEGPEEPVTRSVADPIAALASETGAAADDVADKAAERVASLKQEDAAVLNKPKEDPTETRAATPAEPVSIPPARETMAPRTASSTIIGTHVVQVGAFRSDEEAMAQWARMQTKFGDYLSGKAPDVEEADLGDRGVYHRLRIGPFASSDDAKTYCAGLKERGQDCLVKAK